MVRRLKSIFFVLVLSISVFSGAPLAAADPGMTMNVCPMKCCKESAKSGKTHNSDSKSLCRLLVCSQNMPTGTGSAAQMNLAPVIVASKKISLLEILFSTTPKDPVRIDRFVTFRFGSGQPKYIQHQRILL